MEKVIVSNGATMFRKYVLDVKRENNQTGVYRKIIKKKDNNGETVWSKPYYYQKTQRPDYEVEELILKGNDPKATHTNYRDVYLGSEKPQGFMEDELTLLKEEGKVDFVGKDLVCTTEVLEEIKAIAPDYFSDEFVNVFVLR